MGNSCNEKNPLNLLGTSQYQRLLEALKPSYAKLYSRNEADWILFGRNLASYFQYYNFQNKKDGSWQEFMASDPAVNAALLSRLKEKDNATYQLSLLNSIRATNNIAVLKSKFKFLFDHAFSILYNINREYETLNEELDLSIKLKAVIQSQLARLFRQLKAFYEEVTSSSPVLVDGADTATDNTAPIEIFSSQFCIQKLEGLLLWNYSGTLSDITMEGGGVKDKIKNYASHNLFTGCLNAIVKNSISLGSYSENQLKYLIDSYSDHSPHYALYLAFVKLISYTTEDLNTFSQKHLDFYYKTILKITGKKAEPDSAFLLLENAKNTDHYQVKKGTAFKAGKDSAGKELFYTADEDTVISKAEVAELQNIYLKKTSTYQAIFSGNKANSQDGRGAELTNADQSWLPFRSEASPLAEYGFAIGSHMLFARGGNRFFTITMEVGDTTGLEYLLTGVVSKIKFTGKKGWIEPDPSTINCYVYPGEPYLFINVTVDASYDPIVPFNKELHGNGFDIEDPVCVVYFKNTNSDENLYKTLSQINFTRLWLNCSVSGYKNFTLHNGVTTVDIAKPFDLLGPSPSVGSSFIIGSNEIFYKNQQSTLNFNLYLEWDKFQRLSEQFVSRSQEIKFAFLKNGSFQSNDQAKDTFFFPNLMYFQTYYPFSHYTYDLDRINYEDDASFSVESVDGYIRFQLITKEFGHSYYIRQLAEYAKTGKYKAYPSNTYTATTDPPPAEPYTPAVKSMSVNYDATYCNEVSAGEKNLMSFFLVGPLGNERVDITQADPANYKQFKMLPVFESNGELWIGLKKANPGETVSLLVKVSEGSSDPFQERSDIEWSYWSEAGTWVAFEDKEVADGTNDFTQSGIIKFPLHEDISNNNLMYVSGLHWIKGKIASTGAACNLIDIKAQGIKVTLNDYKNTGVEYTQIRDAGVISKLVNPVPEIKKISQPYSSFNGKIAESGDKYYNRVSERLRHKNRAITMWDYERILLEEFQELYKVKCINHHKCDDTGNYEMVPGHVTVVPVMNLKGNNFINPLRPYTSIGTLVNIERYLRNLISPFVELHVVNPVFEEVQLDFKVVFNSDDTSYCHDQLISDIEAYLTPWAYDSSVGIEFGGSIKKSVLIDFMDELSYVDHVSCVKMFHWVNGTKSQGDKEEITAGSARSVLVSFGGNETEPKHKIETETADCNCG